MSTRYVWSGTSREDPPTDEEDAQFKAAVRQQCMAAGGDAALCDLVADRVFESPTEDEARRLPDAAECKAQMAAARDYLARLTMLCRAYGAPSLLADLRAARVTVAEAAHILAAEMPRSAVSMPAHCVDHVRVRLIGRHYFQSKETIQ